MLKLVTELSSSGAKEATRFQGGVSYRKSLEVFLEDANPQDNADVKAFMKTHLSSVTGELEVEQISQIYKSARRLHELNITKDEVLNVSDKLLLLHEWAGVTDPTLLTVLTIHYNLALGCILQNKASDNAYIRRCVRELTSLESIGVFLATELAYGNNVVNLETRADYDHDKREFVIHTPGPKAQKYMPNTGEENTPKLACVMARLHVKGENQGVFPFIGLIRGANGQLEDGVHVQPLGEKPVYPLDNAVTWFSQVRVPFEAGLLGTMSHIDRHGNFHSEIDNRTRRFRNSVDRVQMGKLCLTASLTKGLLAALKVAFCYSDQRMTFAPKHVDVSIFEYRTHKNSLFKDLSTTFALRAFYMETKELRHQNDKHFENSSYALKYFASENAISILNNLRTRVGAQGMFKENRIFEYLVSAHGTATAEGDNQVIKSKLVKEMLTTDTFSQPQIVHSGPRVPTLEDLKFQQILLHSREIELIRRLKKNLVDDKLKGIGIFESWNSYSIDTIEVADTHAFRMAHDAFLSRINKCENKEGEATLSDICSMFFLSHLKDTAGWYLIERQISRHQMAQVDSKINEIADRLYDKRTDLVHSFDIPNELIGSPILEDYVEAHNFIARIES